jgi:large conductance mechanosensitive channel
MATFTFRTLRTPAQGRTSVTAHEEEAMLNDLKKFLMRGNVIDLAVAVVIGAAFNAVVNAFVEFIVNPLIAAVFGQPDITGVGNLTLRESADPDVADTVLSLGGFLQSILDFLIIGVSLFMVIKAFEKMQERRRQGEDAEEQTPTPSDEAVLLGEIRDLIRVQQR